MAEHKNLKNARNNKKDEFYTRLEDIEQEILLHEDYLQQFQNKIVLCNCDDPEWSNFFLFFKIYFQKLGLKKLVTTHFNKNGGCSYKLEWCGDIVNDKMVNVIKTPLRENGDFRSKECVDLLDEVDIVVTNPPFSLFREYITLLMEHNKKFLIIGNTNAISYTDIFAWIQQGKLWTGYGFNKTMIFEVGKDYKYDEKLTQKINDGKFYGKVPMITWYTNLEINKNHKFLELKKSYYKNQKEFCTYHNYPAINVNKTSDIPNDYTGIMGVPITFLGIFCPEQFEIVGMGYGELAKQIGMTSIGKEFLQKYFEQGNKGNYVANNVLCCYTDCDGNVKIPYARILIKRKL